MGACVPWLPMFPQFSRHFFRHSRYRFISSVRRSLLFFPKPTDEHDQMCDGQRAAIVRKEGRKRDHTTTRVFQIAILRVHVIDMNFVRRRFKEPNLKSCAYTRSAWLAACCMLSAVVIRVAKPQGDRGPKLVQFLYFFNTPRWNMNLVTLIIFVGSNLCPVNYIKTTCR